MNEISISRNHNLSPEAARGAAERVIRDLDSRYSLDWSWDGNVLLFRRSGLSGKLRLDGREATIQMKLGLFLSALRPVIEREIHSFFDKDFGA